jgi:hypothetical protein
MRSITNQISEPILAIKLVQCFTIFDDQFDYLLFIISQE